jgi:hypothetical protein
MYLRDQEATYEDCMVSNNCGDYDILGGTREECKAWAEGFLAYSDEYYGSQLCVESEPMYFGDGFSCLLKYPGRDSTAGWYQGALQPRVCTANYFGKFPDEDDQTLVISKADAESSVFYADWFDGESCLAYEEPVEEPELEVGTKAGISLLTVVSVVIVLGV